jgi:hypothetical protein
VRTVAAAVLLLTVFGCGEPAMSVSDYRDAVRARAVAYADEAEQLRSDHLFQLERSVDELVDHTDPDELEEAVVAETARRTAALFASLTDAVQRYIQQLTELRPPERLEAEHRELVDALELSIAGIGDTMDALGEAGSFAEIDAAIGGASFNDTAPRVDAACRRLESALAQMGVVADLRCAEG